ncbi:MAG: hypothetical protein ABIQ73_24240 [Acidimicrobiales bacterium]
MNVRVKARRNLGLLVSVAAIAFFFVTASPANAQDSVDNNNNNENEHDRDDYSASVHGDCEGGFAVTIKNDSHHDVWALIRLNGVDTTVKVKEDKSVTVQPLDLNEDTPNTILVKIGDKILLQKTFTVNCLPDPASKLSASISSDCGSFSVTVKNDGDADGTATVTVNGSSVNIDVVAGKTVTMTVVLTEDADNIVAVTAGDTDLAHKTIHVNCKEELPAPTTTVAPPTTQAPTTTAPAVQVLGETVQQPTTLAFTGRNTLFESMIGVLLLGFGLQLMRSSRRLEQNS